METQQSRLPPSLHHFVTRRAGHVLVAYDKKLYLWGGYMERPHRTHYDLNTPGESIYHSAIDIWVYESLLDKWKKQISDQNFMLKMCSNACLKQPFYAEYMHILKIHDSGECESSGMIRGGIWALDFSCFILYLIDSQCPPPLA
ncbi:unnamed protein product, partial [Meganyctiphanes norvegica]